jgi:hypothetical protein
MIDIIPVIKTFRGHEFAEASLLSIYNQARFIIYIHSEFGWDGRTGNTVRPIVEAFPDPDKKIIHLTSPEGLDQTEQYNIAIRYMEEKQLAYSYVQLIDTDEIFDDESWRIILPYLEKNATASRPISAVKMHLWDYLKSPLYRIDPPAKLEPVCFIHRSAIKPGIFAIRGSGLFGNSLSTPAWFHHFTGVRNSLTETWDKLACSGFVEDEPLRDKEEWRSFVWNRLPGARCLHPLKNHADVWQGVKVIEIDQLPVILRDHPIVRAWKNYPQSVYSGEVDFAKYGLPNNFGPAHPDWKMPSKQARYKLALNGEQV